jgi:hypothetical protein
MPIFEIRHKTVINGDCRLSDPHFVVANEYPTTLTNDQETYAVRVCEETLLDEISHCETLIGFWKEQPNHPNQRIIIKRQANLTAWYRQLIKEEEETYATTNE